MNRIYSPAQSIERFAQVSAALDQGLAPRALVLCAAGLGEETWDSVERHWIHSLGSNDGAALAHRFGAAYEASMQSLCPLPVEPAGGEDRQSCADGGETLRKIPSHVERTSPAPALELSVGRSSRQMTPFVEPSAEAEPAEAPETQRSRATLLPPAPRELTDGSGPADRAQELPAGRLIGVSVLHQYDPWTGEPLAVPVWMDEVVSPIHRRSDLEPPPVGGVAQP